jgi:hypothetical protein
MNNPFEKPVVSPDAKKKTVVDRVLVNEPQKEEEIMQALIQAFDEQKFYGAEREKTEHESQIIAYLSENIPTFIAQYGGTPVDFTPEHVHVFDPKKYSPDDWQNIKKIQLNAYYAVGMQGVAMLMWHQEDDVQFANICIHELMHLHSFQSLHAQEDDTANDQHHVIERRSGMQIFGNGESENDMTTYFHWLNEAITEELTRRFVQEHHADIPGIEEGMKKRRRHFPEMSESELISSTHIYENVDPDDKGSYEWGDHHTYKEYREELNDVIDAIYDKNTDRFASREDVFAIFAQAYFTGRLLPLARLIDHSLGKGTFAQMAKEKSQTDSTEHHTITLNKKSS